MIQTIQEFLIDESTVKEFASLYEDSRFKFDDHLAEILTILNKDKFKHLAAKSAKDIKLGLLSKTQIETLRQLLGSAFVNNNSMRDIQLAIARKIDLKDRYKIKNGEKVLMLNAAERPKIIARTETIRLANEGAVKNFKNKGVEQLEYAAVLDSRTDDECTNLDGKIFDVNESKGIIPVHPGCRCTWLPVIS